MFQHLAHRIFLFILPSAEQHTKNEEADGGTGYESAQSRVGEFSWGPGVSSEICEIDIGEEEVEVIHQDVGPK